MSSQSMLSSQLDSNEVANNTNAEEILYLESLIIPKILNEELT